MSIVLGVLQLFLIGVILYLEFKRKSSAVFLWATLFVMFGVMHFYTTLVGDSSYKPNTISDASVFVLGFCSVYIIVRYLILQRNNHKEPTVEECIFSTTGNSFDKESVAFLAVFVAVIVFKNVLYILSVGSLKETSWGALRDFSADLPYINVLQPLNVLYFLLSGVGLYFVLIKRHVLAGIVISMVLFDTLITRNRIEILPALVILITIFILRTKKITVLRVVSALLLGLVVLYTVYATRAFRHYGTLESFIKNGSFADLNSRILKHIVTGSGELGLRRDFYFFMSNNNKFENFGQGHSYLRMLMVFVPTKWSFGIKPPDFAQSMGAAIGMVPGGSTHPTLFGDCFANLGWWGICLGAFWALYAAIGDWAVKRSKRSVSRCIRYVLLGSTYVIIGRGSVYNAFVFVAYGFILSFAYRVITPRIMAVVRRHIR